jgi:hypothetical protein
LRELPSRAPKCGVQKRDQNQRFDASDDHRGSQDEFCRIAERDVADRRLTGHFGQRTGGAERGDGQNQRLFEIQPVAASASITAASVRMNSMKKIQAI